jgi:hypothetical protein
VELYSGQGLRQPRDYVAVTLRASSAWSMSNQVAGGPALRGNNGHERRFPDFVCRDPSSQALLEGAVTLLHTPADFDFTPPVRNFA